MRSIYSSRRTQTSIDSVMTPMIDVVFLLLIFFLASASFQRLEKSLPSAIAASPDKSAQGNQATEEPPQGLSDLSDVVIEIKSVQAGNGPKMVSYRMNGEVVADLESLTQRLVAILKVRTDVPIVIDPDSKVPAGDAIYVYDLAKAKGALAAYLVAK
jgi:biopolymer transport protein ExbD